MCLISILNAVRAHSAVSQEGLNCFVEPLHSFPLRWLHILPVWPSGQKMRPMRTTVGRDVSWFPCLLVKTGGKGEKNGGDTSRNVLASSDASPEPPIITCTERLIDLIFVHHSHICLQYNRVEGDSQRHCSCITAESRVSSHGSYVLDGLRE